MQSTSDALFLIFFIDSNSYYYLIIESLLENTIAFLHLSATLEIEYAVQMSYTSNQ